MNAWLCVLVLQGELIGHIWQKPEGCKYKSDSSLVDPNFLDGHNIWMGIEGTLNFSTYMGRHIDK